MEWRVLGRAQAQSEVREAARARRGGGLESARSGLEPGGPLPAQARFLLSLQQSAGNRAVRGLVQGRFAPVQRESAEEEEPLQGRFAPVQRQAGEDEEELQMKAAPSAAAQLQPESPPRPNETGLPDGLKSGIESLSGISLDDVRVHYGSAQPAQLNALAYAQGSEIHVAPGQEQHLPHEARHVVQQAQGRVQPTMQLQDGVPVNDDEGLEQEADAMGAKAVAGAAQLQSGPEEEELLQGKFAPLQRMGVQRRVGTWCRRTAGHPARILLCRQGGRGTPSDSCAAPALGPRAEAGHPRRKTTSARSTEESPLM